MSGKKTTNSSSRPGITRTASGHYRARYRDPQGVEHQTTKPTFAAADRWLREQSASIVRNDHVAPRRAEMRFGEWAQQSLASMVHLKPKTLAGYESLLDSRILPTWRDVKLGGITNAAVAAWVASMQEAGLSASRTRQAFGLLSAMLDGAVRDRRLSSNPAAGVKLPRMPKTQRRYLDHEQLELLAQGCGPHRALVFTLGYCGLRWGEAAALRVRNVNPMRGRITITESVAEVHGKIVFGAPKTHQHRDVVVPTFLRDDLAAQLAGKKPDAFVFDDDGDVFRNHRFRQRWFDRAARAAGLDGFVIHELRHTAASMAIAAGASIKGVQSMLGHSTATLTLDLYGHLYPDELDAVADRLDAARSKAMRASCGQQTVSEIRGRRRG